jgi:hypothetical protein
LEFSILVSLVKSWVVFIEHFRYAPLTVDGYDPKHRFPGAYFGDEGSAYGAELNKNSDEIRFSYSVRM